MSWGQRDQTLDSDDFPRWILEQGVDQELEPGWGLHSRLQGILAMPGPSATSPVGSAIKSQVRMGCATGRGFTSLSSQGSSPNAVVPGSQTGRPTMAGEEAECSTAHQQVILQEIFGLPLDDQRGASPRPQVHLGFWTGADLETKAGMVGMPGSLKCRAENHGWAGSTVPQWH